MISDHRMRPLVLRVHSLVAMPLLRAGSASGPTPDLAVPPVHVRVYRFFEARRWLVDTLCFVVPLGLVVLARQGAIGDSLQSWILPGSAWLLALILELLTVLPLALRRTHPAVSSGVIAVGAFAQVVTLVGPGVSLVTVPVAVFSTAKYGGRRSARTVLGLGLFGAVMLGMFTYMQGRRTPRVTGEEQVLFLGLPLHLWAAVLLLTGFAAAVVTTSWLLGDLGGRRRREIAAIAERNWLLEREREQEARLAADAERMRIAREMHDVISHSMSVMIAQADGGRYVLEQDPPRAYRAFEAIGATGREALAEMRRMLGILREDREEQLTRPAPGLQGLPGLVADVRAAGLTVSLSGADHRWDLPEGAELAVYRIVQEALTNTLKHARGATSAHVRLVEEDGMLVVTVSDDGGRVPPEGGAPRRTSDDAPTGAAGVGSGIIGMTERARLYGGTVTAGPSAGGFLVTLRLPIRSMTDGTHANGWVQEGVGDEPGTDDV